MTLIANLNMFLTENATAIFDNATMRTVSLWNKDKIGTIFL